MNYLKDNQWLGYLERSYQQIKDTIMTKMGFNLPEITDHTESNIFVKIVSIFSGIIETVHYYIDSMGREAIPSVARVYANMVKHARTFDYRIHARNAATVDVTFNLAAKLSVDFQILANTVVGNEDGSVLFRTLYDTKITAGSKSVTVAAVQSIQQPVLTLQDTHNGRDGYEAVLFADLYDSHLTVNCGGKDYALRDTLAFSIFNDYVVVQNVNEKGIPVIRFGDGHNGFKPAKGDSINIGYESTSGADGNLAAKLVNTIYSSLNVPESGSVSVINNTAATGGTAIEDIESIRKHIILSNRTTYKAVTPQDFVDIAQLVPGVAGASKPIATCGKNVTVYIVPEGGGVASNQLLLDTFNFIDERDIFTTLLTVKSAGQIDLLINIDIKIRQNYSRLTAITNVKNAIVKLFNVDRAGQVGESFRIGDLYEVIEDPATGVDSSVVTGFIPLPYAAPSDDSPLLVWTKELQKGSVANIQWVITMISATQYQLIKNNSFVGTFAVGQTVSRDEIVFTINDSNYVQGNRWTFFTYPYDAMMLELEEPSILNANINNINITTKGGI